jgi:hypothetical protein
MTKLLIPAIQDVILRRELIEAGHTDRDIAKLVKAGELARARHGAYVDGPRWQAEDETGRLRLRSRAVLRQAKAPVVLSHIAAAAEYDAPLWDVPTDIVHVTRRDRKAGRNEAGVRQHQGRLAPEDVVTRAGVDVTSATRTAIDVTTVAGTESALCVVNHLLHERHTDLTAIRRRYESMVHDPHTLHTDLVLRLADPRVESIGESRTAFVMWKQGIPYAEPQFVITDEVGREIARLDFAWPRRGRWLEFDGKQKYVKFLREGESVTDAVLREKEREDLIRELTGWRCLRITWADLANPQRLAARIRRFLG